MPCYDLLVQVLPSTAPMQTQCSKNLDVWKEKAEQRKKDLEAAEAEIKNDESEDELKLSDKEEEE